MDIDNKAERDEKLYRKGFGTELNAEVDAKIQSGEKEFTSELTKSVKLDEAGTKHDEVEYRLHWKHDVAEKKIYLNTIEVTLLKMPDAPGEARTHKFPADWNITANEAYRMLKYGDKVSVKKKLFNKESKQYETYISIDIKGPKDDFGNYPVNTYHDNYFLKQPFNVIESLKAITIPVQQLENKWNLSDFAKRMGKAQLIEVKMMVDDMEQKGFLSINPKDRRVDLLDEKLKLVQTKEQKMDLPQQEVSNQIEAPAPTQEDEKKKNSENQSLSQGKTIWSDQPKTRQGHNRGLSH